MLICSKCNNEQSDGKFCGVCGSLMEAKVQASEPTIEPERVNEPVVNQAPVEETPPPVPPQPNPVPNQHTQQQQYTAPNQSTNESAATTATNATSQQTTETIKKGLNNYWTYFVHIIKNPNRAFQTDENQMVNGLVTIGLYAILFSLSLYFLANSLSSSFFGTSDVPFFPVVSRIFIAVVVMILITFGSMILMSKIGKSQDSFQKTIAQYGALLIPFTTLNLLATIGGLIASVSLTLFSLGISSILTFAYIPVLFVYQKVTEVNNNGQKLYLSFATILLISLILYFVGESLVINMLEELDNSFYW